MAIATVGSPSTLVHASSGAVTTSAVDTTGANLLVAYVAWASSGPIPTLTDTYSNTWTMASDPGNGATSDRGAIFHCLSPTVGTGHTVGITTGCTLPQIQFQAFSGVSAHGGDTGSITLSPGTLTPAVDGCLFVSNCVWRVSGTPATCSPPTFTVNSGAIVASGSEFGQGSAYYIQPTAASVTPTWGPSGGTNPVTTMTYFTAAAGGGGGSIILPPYLFDTMAI